MGKVMADYRLLFSKKAQRDIEQLTAQQKVKLQETLLQVLVRTPHAGKKLKGKLKGLYSYRLNRKDRIVYEIIEEDEVVFVIRVKTHYGE